ncbi:MAG: hypothetical protein HWE27_11630 [Gammaproteobacteria bacterium]|nr:hypothetical protein [Gammaproteobacteria bacterium]
MSTNQPDSNASYNPLQKLMQLSSAQLKLSKAESVQPVETLSKYFTDIADLTQQIMSQNAKQQNSPLDHMLLEQLHMKIHKCVTAFQFYDRLTQQIEHVITQLDSAAAILSESDRTAIDVLHSQLSEMKKHYSMESEREIYQAVLNGECVNTVLSKREQSNDKDPNHSIELF